MIKYFMLLLIFSASFGLAASNEEAIRFVEELGLGENLKPMAARAVMQTTTFRLILDEVGKETAQNIIVPALNTSISKYQSDWNEGLATAYLEYFSEEQLKSIREEKQSSPYFGDLEKNQALVGVFMQENSKPLLVKIVSETMQSAYQKSMDLKK